MNARKFHWCTFFDTIETNIMMMNGTHNKQNQMRNAKLNVQQSILQIYIRQNGGGFGKVF